MKAVKIYNPKAVIYDEKEREVTCTRHADLEYFDVNPGFKNNNLSLVNSI